MRKDRVASVLEREVSNIVTKEIRDPRLGFITITGVELTADLKTATVYFSSLGDKSETLKTLKRAKGFIRTMLAQRVRFKAVPELEFEIDNSYEYQEKINALFKKISSNNKEE